MASQRWAMTVYKASRARTNELQTIGILALRASLLSYLWTVSFDKPAPNSNSLPLTTLVLLISISAVEVVNNISLVVSGMATFALCLLAYFLPRSVLLS